MRVQLLPIVKYLPQVLTMRKDGLIVHVFLDRALEVKLRKAQFGLA